MLTSELHLVMLFHVKKLIVKLRNLQYKFNWDQLIFLLPPYTRKKKFKSMLFCNIVASLDDVITMKFFIFSSPLTHTTLTVSHWALFVNPQTKISRCNENFLCPWPLNKYERQSDFTTLFFHSFLLFILYFTLTKFCWFLYHECQQKL